MLLIKRTGTVETDLNVRASQKLSVALTGLTLLAAASTIVAPWAGLAAAAGLAAIVGLNRPFFAFLARRKGWRFACASVPLHLVYYCCCGLSVVIATAHWQLGRFRRGASRPGRAAVPAPHLASERRQEKSFTQRRKGP
jgi:hypothetical protein